MSVERWVSLGGLLYGLYTTATRYSPLSLLLQIHSPIQSLVVAVLCAEGVTSKQEGLLNGDLICVCDCSDKASSQLKVDYR